MRPHASGLVVALVLGCASSAWAAELHVAPGASGSGSEAEPFGSIDAAMAVASAGDQIVLHDWDAGGEAEADPGHRAGLHRRVELVA